jgi:hypothetical protein
VRRTADDKLWQTVDQFDVAAVEVAVRQVLDLTRARHKMMCVRMLTIGGNTPARSRVLRK